MVLEILADPGKGVMHRDARLGQDLGVADPGQLQQMPEPTAPPARMISHAASALSIELPCPPLRENSTPVARVPSKTTRCTSAPVMTRRLGRFVAGFR